MPNFHSVAGAGKRYGPTETQIGYVLEVTYL